METSNKRPFQSCTTCPPQKREVLWALEELADAGIKYNVVNLHWGRADTYTVPSSQFPLGKTPSVTLEHVNGESEVTYQIPPNFLTEARLILQFISDHYTDGVWIPESEEDRPRATFCQEFANSSLLTKVDNIKVLDTGTVVDFCNKHNSIDISVPRTKWLRSTQGLYQPMVSGNQREIFYDSSRTVIST